MCQYQRVFEQSTTVNNNKTKDIRNIKRGFLGCDKTTN